MARAVALLLLSGSVLLGLSSGTGPDSERGRMELRRVQNLAAQPQYGECWARALEHLDTCCRDMTSDSQSRLALRPAPSTCQSNCICDKFRCRPGSLSRTWFHFRQSSHCWQQKVLTCPHLSSPVSGLRSVLSDLSGASRAQQVVLLELFDRVSFLLMEAHSLSSCCYNAAALCIAFLITSTRRLSRARLVLLALVCLNFYLERKIYQVVLSPLMLSSPGELVSVYVGVLRRVMVCVGVCILLLVCVRYRDPVQQSLQVLQQLRETQKALQEALRRAGESPGENTCVSNRNRTLLDRTNQLSESGTHMLITRTVCKYFTQ
uniref:Uncharacterized protein n=1 Tax=Kryptolebias marmoratus TaxID=37003 RepID=A0A3Q3B853_KRYMA